MLDENIGSSPHKHDRSIHKVRLKRQSQRRKLDDSMSASLVKSSSTLSPGHLENEQNEEKEFSSVNLRNLYESSDQETSYSSPQRPVRIAGNFNPYNEEVLITADKVAPSVRPRVKVATTHNFVSGSSALLEMSTITKQDYTQHASNATTRNAFPSEWATTELGITDSELLSFCAEAEEQGASQSMSSTTASAVPIQTPQTSKSKSIVEMILNDFDTSPMSSPEVRLSEESPYIFRFANQPLRTYNRREARYDDVRARRSIMARIENVTDIAMDDDSTSNASSSGLSVQEDCTQVLVNECNDTSVHNSQALCDNLLNLSAYLKGLSNSQGNEGSDSTRLDSKTDKSDEYRPNTTSRSIAEGETLIEKDGNVEVKGQKPMEECFFLDDIDEWNDDCDFAADLRINEESTCSKFEDVNPLVKSPTTNSDESPQFMGFRTASKKPIKISKEATARAASILNEVNNPQSLIKLEDTKHHFPNRDVNDSPQIMSFCTASKKAITISKEAEKRAANILELNSTQSSFELDESKHHHPNDDVKYSPQFVGFRTASKKAINISKEAEARAAKILNELNALPLTVEFAETPNVATAHNTFKSKTLEDVKHSQQSTIEHFQENLENIQFSEWILEDEKPITKTSPTKYREKASKNTINIAETVCNLGVMQNSTNVKSKENCLGMQEQEMSSISTTKIIHDNDVFENESNIGATNTGNKRKLEQVSATCSASKLLCTSTNICDDISNDFPTRTPLSTKTSRTQKSRKNLLSLKRRTSQRRIESYEAPDHLDESPIKEVASANDIAPDTPLPNLNEFFHSVARNTSTPAARITRSMLQCAQAAAESNSTTYAEEFKPIEWEATNDSATGEDGGSGIKTPSKEGIRMPAKNRSNISDDNITLMDPGATPKQRIARLQVYSKPPQVSPILMFSNDNCRPSGLRRRDRNLINQ